MDSYWNVICALILPNFGSVIGGLVMAIQRKYFGGNIFWYKSLKRPTYEPPSWVFGPVWTFLFTSMGYASYLVWRDGGGFKGPAKLPLMMYISQLVLNWAWTPIFFGLHSLKWGFIDIAVLHLNVSFCGLLFYDINPIAGYIFIPYVTWLTLATYINYYLWCNNPNDKPKLAN